MCPLDRTTELELKNRAFGVEIGRKAGRMDDRIRGRRTDMASEACWLARLCLLDKKHCVVLSW